MEIKLINYLHSVYPELEINLTEMKGYSSEEISKIERLYDINITNQLYDFLVCMGRYSGGFFCDYPLMFYRSNKDVRSHVLSQIKLREDLSSLQQWDLLTQKPFLVSFESETQYYFLLTAGDNPDLVYHYDENEDTVEATNWTFNEYLKLIVKVFSMSYTRTDDEVLDYCGELIII